VVDGVELLPAHAVFATVAADITKVQVAQLLATGAALEHRAVHAAMLAFLGAIEDVGR
jgi:hypothetical protein